MRSLVLSILAPLAILTAAGCAFAQAPTPDAEEGSAPRAHARSVAHEECRAEADGKSLTGDERRLEMRTCVQAHLEACRTRAEEARVPREGGERREFVRHCMQQGA